MKDEWVHPDDPTDILPDELRQSARRRRVLVRVGGVVVAALVIVLILMVEAGGFLAKAWMYGSTYQTVFGAGR